MSTTVKALSLLNLFTQSQRELRLGDIAHLSGMDKATAYRHLTALKKAGLLEQIYPQKTYRIGAEVLRLANIREATVPMLETAKKILKLLSEYINETTHVSLIKNDRLITVAYSYSKAHAMGVIMGDKDSHPLHATSSGLCVLAYSHSKFIEEVLSRKLQSYTPETITTADEIASLLDVIRQQGYAETNGSFETGLHSFAAPIFNASADIMGAISITAPSERVNKHNEKKYSSAVIKAAAELSRQIGGIAPNKLTVDFAA